MNLKNACRRVRLAAMTGALLCGNAPAQVSQSQAALKSEAFESVAARAAAAYEANDLPEARALYEKNLAARPAWGEGWWYLGSTLYQMDEYQEARRAFAQVVRLQPANGPAHAMLGLCEFQEKKYAQALAHIQRGRQLGLGDNHELNAAALYHAGILSTREKDFEVAVNLLYLSSKSRAATPALLAALGLAMLHIPVLPAEAPDDKRELILNMGRAVYAFNNRDYEVARRAFEELVKAHAQTSQVHYAYGLFLLQQRDNDALREFQAELHVSPDHVLSRLQLAFEYIKRRKYAVALPFAEQAVRLAPRSYVARNALGRILLETGATRRAVAQLEEGVRLAGHVPEMRFALAQAYARAGRTTEAARERRVFARLEKNRQQSREVAP